MAANNRIFYACQGVAFAPENKISPAYVAHGVQSVGITTNFNLEQAFELGQIQIYENIEGLPDVEVTLEKVLDGYPLMYHLATSEADRASLVNRTKQRCNVALGIYPDDKDVINGDAPVEVFMSGMYVSNISYSFPTDGNATESITLVGNNKEWNLSPKLLKTALAAEITQADGVGLDEPLALDNGRGGIQRRENFVMMSSILPRSIYGISSSKVDEDGYGIEGNNWDDDRSTPYAHVQSCTISTDVGREDILELGRKSPYYRAPNFPVEVTCEFEVIAVSGDWVSAKESGSTENNRNRGNNTSEERIKIQLDDLTQFDLGKKNRLTSVTYGGGDAGGGNATITYSYITYNDLSIYHEEDPAALVAPTTTTTTTSTTTSTTTTTTTTAAP